MGRKSDARRRLMDAAYDLICEYGYGAVTIEAICSRAKVKKGTFYHFFESKSDLAVAAIDTWWAGREKKLAELFAPEFPPVERLERYFDFVVAIQLEAHARSGQLPGCPLFTLGAEICMQDERIRLRVLDFIGRLGAVAAGTIAEAQKRGEIAPGNAHEKARTLFCLYEGLLTLARIEDDAAQMENLGRAALEAIGAGTVIAAIAAPA